MPQLLVYDGATEIPCDYARQIRALLHAEGFFEAPPADVIAGAPLTAPELHPVYFLVLKGRTVQSYGRTIWAQIEHLGHHYKMYGLGDVITRPAVRKMGFGSRVVEAATAHIRGDSDSGVAVLLTDPKLEPFYARHGWKHVPGLVLSAGEHNNPQGLEGLPMMLFVSAAAKAARTIFHTLPLILPGDEW